MTKCDATDEIEFFDIKLLEILSCLGVKSKILNKIDKIQCVLRNSVFKIYEKVCHFTSEGHWFFSGFLRHI